MIKISSYFFIQYKILQASLMKTQRDKYLLCSQTNFHINIRINSNIIYNDSFLIIYIYYQLQI